jgi:hypothetical protein
MLFCSMERCLQSCSSGLSCGGTLRPAEIYGDEADRAMRRQSEAG